MLDVLLNLCIIVALLRLWVLENIIAELQLEAADAVGTDDGSSPALRLGIVVTKLGISVGLHRLLFAAGEEQEGSDGAQKSPATRGRSLMQQGDPTPNRVKASTACRVIPAGYWGGVISACISASY